jgi:iron-sulfur cluster assembly protein
MLPSFSITPAAQTFIRRILRFSGLPAGAAGFRLVVSAGGCSGHSCEFSAESKPADGDEVFESEGLRLFLPAESRLLLEGVTLDFVDSPTQSGLVVHDPHHAACGCGSFDGKAPAVTTIAVGAIGRGRPSVLNS